MLRTKVDAQPSLWEDFLPPEVSALPPGLEAIDRPLGDPVFQPRQVQPVAARRPRQRVGRCPPHTCSPSPRGTPSCATGPQSLHARRLWLRDDLDNTIVMIMIFVIIVSRDGIVAGGRRSIRRIVQPCCGVHDR